MGKDPKSINELFDKGQAPDPGESKRSNQYQEKPIKSLNLIHAQVPIEIMEMPIKNSAFRIYAYLMARAGKKGVCWYSQYKLSEVLHMDRKTVRTGLLDLQEHNLIRGVAYKGRIYYVVLYVKIQQGKPIYHNLPETDSFFSQILKLPDWSKHIVDIAVWLDPGE